MGIRSAIGRMLGWDGQGPTISKHEAQARAAGGQAVHPALTEGEWQEPEPGLFVMVGAARDEAEQDEAEPEAGQ